MSKDSPPGHRKTKPPRKPAEPIEPLVPLPPPSTAYNFDSLHFLPQRVRVAAKRLKETGLKGVMIEERCAADDPPIVHFLTTLNEAGEIAALTQLAGLLRSYPLILTHPYVWETIKRFYSGPGSWSPDDELNKYLQGWLVELVTAWAEGMTLGGVTVKRAKPQRRGRPPVLFPRLSEREGWLPSDAANADIAHGADFIMTYLDLHERLRNLDDWKVKSAEFRQNPEYVVPERALDVKKAFEQFKREKSLDGVSISETEYKEIVKTGFNEVYKGHSPRHEITCQLLATLKWGTGKPVTSSLINKTLETLRKHFSEDFFRDLRLIRGIPHLDTE